MRDGGWLEGCRGQKDAKRREVEAKATAVLAVLDASDHPMSRLSSSASINEFY